MRSISLKSYFFAFVMFSGVGVPATAVEIWTNGVSREGGWHDANKGTAYNGKENFDSGYTDTLMCWAAQASNMLQWWQDRYVQEGGSLPAGIPNGLRDGKDPYGLRQYEIFEMFCRSFDDRGWASNSSVLPWYFSGDASYILNDERQAQLRADRLSIGGSDGGYFRDSYLSDDDFDKSGHYVNDQRYSSLSSFSSAISAYLENDWVIGLNVTDHALTLWGVECEDYITKIYYTDSDDGASRLCTATVTESGNKLTIRDINDGYTADVVSIVALQAFVIPEPSAFGLLAGLGALALVASRRRRE